MRGWRASALAISTICRRDSDRSLTSASGWMSSRAGARQRLLGHAALGAAVDQAEAPRRVADRDVVGHRQIGDQRQLLEDADDAGRVGRRRRRERDRLAVEQHAALVGLHDAGHDLDQRRLARAVLAEHRVDAAGLDDEVGLLQRAHAAVALRDALHRRTGSCSASAAPRDDRGAGRRDYLFASVCPMISCAVKLMPQVGKELPTKKLSDCFVVEVRRRPSGSDPRPSPAAA